MGIIFYFALKEYIYIYTIDVKHAIFIFQMTEVLKAGVLSDEIDLGALAHNAAEQAEEFVRKVKGYCISIIISNKNIFSL